MFTVVAAGPIGKRGVEDDPATCEIGETQVYLYNKDGKPSLEDIDCVLFTLVPIRVELIPPRQMQTSWRICQAWRLHRRESDFRSYRLVSPFSHPLRLNSLVELDPEYIKERIKLTDDGTNEKWIKYGCKPNDQPRQVLVEALWKGGFTPSLDLPQLGNMYDGVAGSAWMSLLQYPATRVLENDEEKAENWPNLEENKITHLLEYTGATVNAKLDHQLEKFWNSRDGEDKGFTEATSAYKDKEGTFNEDIIQPAKDHKLPMILALDPDAPESASGLFVKDTMYTLIPSDSDSLGMFWLHDVTKPKDTRKMVTSTQLFDEEGLKLTYIMKDEA